MRYLFYLILCFLMISLTSCHVQDRSIDIGDGLVLEIIHREFKTITDNTRCVGLLNAIERGEIPVTSETKTETVIVQEGFTSVAVKPIIYKSNGSVKTEAKATLYITPAVTKQVMPPKVIAPSEEMRRKPSVICKPLTRRIISNPPSYKIKNKSGATIKHFETAKALAEYINSK